jgi:indolepyruvate ferredoxin oxidoreductase beta subunit
MNTVNVLLSGVGGQGVLLASRILSEAALADGLDIKQSEVHGMSQRGGSVVSHVRIGDRVNSPIVPDGSCDILVGFEPLEALRHAHVVRAQGVVLHAVERINPSTVSAGFAAYPEDLEEQLAKFPCKKISVPAGALAESVGNRRSANVVMVGALSPLLPFGDDVWTRALEASIPAKILPLNLKAFELGRRLVAEKQGGAS